MALNFNNIKKNNQTNSTPQNQNVNPVTQPGFNLTFTNGSNYDLDQIIADKLRSNSEATLNLRVYTDEEVKTKLIELVTKKILDDYGIDYSESESAYKQKVKQILNFSTIFDEYYNRYYNEYKKIITSDSYNGSISIDTVLREINLTKVDVKNYTLTDVDNAKDSFVVQSRNRPIVIWTDGTDDPGTIKPSESVLYRNELYSYLYDTLISKDDRVVLSKDQINNQMNIELNNVATNTRTDSIESKVDGYFDALTELQHTVHEMQENWSTGGNVDIKTVDEIIYDDKTGTLTTPNSAVPSVKAVFNLFSDYFAVFDRSVEKDSLGDYTLSVSSLSTISDDTITMSPLDKIVEDENGDYILEIYDLNNEYDDENNGISIIDHNDEFILDVGTTSVTDNNGDYLLDIDAGNLIAQGEDYLLDLD